VSSDSASKAVGAAAIGFSAAPETARAAAAWLASLARERRLSDKTVEAYGRDLRQFLTFLTTHLGAAPTVAAIVGLKPLDIRAFLAARRVDGIESRSLMRQLAALRSFARYLEREGHGTPSAFSAIRSPKISKGLPRPVNPSAAVALTQVETRGGEEREPWILARDAAVLALLYGAGLRISEALGIKRQDAPVGDIDAVTVMGKGGKVRSVPVIPPVRRAVEDYIAGRFSSAPKAGRSRRASSSSRWRDCAAPSGCPIRRLPMPCVIRLRRTFWSGAESCAPFRSCSATPRSRPRKFTLKLIHRGCSPLTKRRIPAPASSNPITRFRP
jgi:site-specific recombinase XerC